MAPPLRLGERLVRDGVVTPAQLRRALEAQVIEGGRIGTSLVQIEALDLDKLTLALSQQLGVPPGTTARFKEADPAVVARLSPTLAARHQAVPLSVTRGAVEVALVEPRRAAVVDAVSAALGARVVPLVAAELRLAYYLEALYGVTRPARFLRMPPPPPDRGADERRRFVTASPPLPAPVQAPDDRSALRSTLARITPVKRATASMAPVTAASPDDFDLPIDVDNRRVSDGARAAIDRLAVAENGPELGAAIVTYLREHVGCGLALVVREEAALGWVGHASTDEATLQAIAVPLHLPTALQIARDARATYCGPPPPAGETWHARLAELLGSPPPREIVVVPICTPDRVAGLVYAHLHGGAKVPDAVVTDLEALCGALGDALVRLGGGR